MTRVNQTSIDFATRQIVTREVSTLPYVGFEKTEDLPEGWKYDIKRWSSPFDLRLPVLPRLADSDFQGVDRAEYFKSGVASVEQDDLKVKEVAEIFLDNERLWVPVIEQGEYFRYDTKHTLYGDNSRVQYVDPTENVDDRNIITLDAVPSIKDSFITAATYQRDPKFKIPTYFKNPQLVQQFSGLYTDGTEEMTLDKAKQVIWDSVDTTKHEFLLDDTVSGDYTVRFNKDFTESIGVVPAKWEDVGACEELGISNTQDYQVFRLPHFPVLANDDFHLYVADFVGKDFKEWNRVDTYHELLNGGWVAADKKYFLDKDYGHVYFGTSAVGGVPAVGRVILASYTTTVRLEYEEEGYSTDTRAFSADTSPVTQQTNQGFVCITHELTEAASISLEIDKERIAFTTPIEYGPVHTGADYGILKASVLSQSGLPIGGVEVSFEMSPISLGAINGGTSSIGATTNDGEAFASYQPPVSAESLGIYTTLYNNPTYHPDYPGDPELILGPEGADLIGQEEYIYTYLVNKNDLLLGYKTIDLFLQDPTQIEKPAWVPDYESDEYGDWKTEMIEAYDLVGWQEAYIAAQAAGSSTLPGRKTVLYKWLYDQVINDDPTAIHPVTGETGAVVPLRPKNVSKITEPLSPHFGKYRVVYHDGAVNQPQPDIAEHNIGGYWLVASRLLSFRASCYSPYYNATIYSNEVLVRVGLPPYLLGEYIANNLDRIPFGWKIISDGDNVAAGLDGATFITINPSPGPYQILDLVNDSVPEDAPEGWASAPFKSVGFTFEIV